MKAPLIALAVVVIAFAIVAGAVFGLGDEEVFVQPPERVTEEFVHAVSLGQGGAARAMLSRGAERGTTSGDIRGVSDEFRARVGRVERVEGRVAERRRDTVMVRAEIAGERANAQPVVVLVREHGEWSITHPSDVLATDDSASARP